VTTKGTKLGRGVVPAFRREVAVRRSSMNADAEILARVRALGAVYRIEPGGTWVPIIGLEEMGDLWPPDVR